VSQLILGPGVAEDSYRDTSFRDFLSPLQTTENGKKGEYIFKNSIPYLLPEKLLNHRPDIWVDRPEICIDSRGGHFRYNFAIPLVADYEKNSDIAD